MVGLAGISFDITEQKNVEKQLLKTQENLKAANAAKSEFLANMRHDFRTPFTGILGVAQMMQNSETDADKRKKLSYIVESAQVLLDQLNEIFDFIQNDSGHLPLLDQRLSLRKLVTDVIATMHPVALKQSIDLLVELDDDLPCTIISDRLRVQRIISNLLTNAIKFTQKGHVKLRVSLAKAERDRYLLRYVVSDTGIGIPPEKQSLIFERFSRLTPSYQGLYGGKGLGLHTVKRFLHDLEGEIDLHSEEGRGSTFTILIPHRRPLLDECNDESNAAGEHG